MVINHPPISFLISICIIYMSWFKNLVNHTKSNKFTNWGETVINKQIKKFYPKNDDDIRRIIKKAIKYDYQIRVCGIGHSSTPMVCDSNEKNIYLVSLKDYNFEPTNLHIDHENMTVEVNAGWSLGQLYDKMSKYNYYLPTHPDIPVFTVGGVVNSTIHGSRLGASLLSDYVVAITLIDADGNRITKTNADSDFHLYTLSFGLFGIVIGVKFKIQKLYMEAKVTNYYNIFIEENGQTKVKRSMTDKFFKDIINKSLVLNSENVHYNHSFIDYHNNALISIDWNNGTDKINIVDNFKEIEIVNTIKPLEFILKNLIKNYREKEDILKLLGKTARHQIAFSIEKNFQEDSDMFWVEYGMKTVFMSYFIPIHTEGDPINLDTLYTAIEVVAEEVKKFKKDNKHFNIDLPVDIRFVCSTENCFLSPINHLGKKIVYVSIELLTMNNNIEFFDKKINCWNKNINRDFRQFYYNIEQKWKGLGGITHLSKVFGFSGISNNPFDPFAIGDIYPDSIKLEVKNKHQHIFTNNFLTNLFNL